MSEKHIDPYQIHTCGRTDFDFAGEHSYILSVGNDCLLKKINFRTREVAHTVDLLDPTYAIAVHPDNKNLIYIGGENEKVEAIESYNIDQPFPIMHFNGAVHNITISQDKNYIGACSIDTGVIVYNVIENKAYRPKPTHESSCLHIGFNSTAKYVSSTGCDGYINIYSIPKMEDNPIDCRVKSQKIGKETKLEEAQIFKADWHPVDNMIALPGNLALQILRESSDGSWTYSIDSGIKHQKELSAVCWNENGQRLMTFCVDKIFKLWNYHTKELIQYCNYGQVILNIKYSPSEKVFGFVNVNGLFGYWGEHERSEDFKRETPKILKKPSTSKKLAIESDIEEELNEIDRYLEEEQSNQNQKPLNQIKEETVDQENFDFDIPENSEAENKETPMIQKEENPSVSKMIPMQNLSIEDKPEKAFEMEFEKKPHKVSKQYDILDFPPQPILYSSSTTLNKNRRFLCWNLVGTIALRNEIDYSAIDIDFTNKSFHSGILLKDIYGISMATMNEKGIVLASRAEEVREDEYEDDLKDETRKFSHIIFRPLNYQLEEKKEWVHALPKGENADAVAIGNNWFAVITDLHLIRIFNFKGIETKFLCLEKPLVCAAGYENLLAIVYHDAPPFLGCQCLKLRVIDLESNKNIYHDSLPITPNTTLTWFGFSDGGMIFTQDSLGTLRGLAGFQEWYPLHVAKDDKKHTRLWMIGVHEYNFIGVLLDKDDLEPSAYSRPPVKSMKIKFPFITEEDYYNKKSVDILKKQIIITHEKFRNQTWLEHKLTREKNDNLYYYSENILDKREIQGAEDNIEKSIVDLFQDCVLNQDFEKALILASTLKSLKSLNVCLFICSKNNIPNLAQKIQSFIEARKMIAGIQKVSHESRVGGNEIVIMKGSQVDPILESRNKTKKGLSAHAIQLPHQKKQMLEETPSPDKNDSGYKGSKITTTEDVVGGILDTLGRDAEIKENKNVINMDRETPSKITPSREIFAKKKSIFEEFSDKNINSNKTSQQSSQNKRKQDQPPVREDLKRVKEGRV